MSSATPPVMPSRVPLPGERSRRLRAIVAALIAALATLLPAAGVPEASAAGACATTTTSTYAVQICVTAPPAGSVLTGTATATATATVLSGSGSVQRLIFSLDGAYLLTDYQAPYTFSLPSAAYVDGVHALSAAALMRDGTTTASAAESLTFSNGVNSPPPPNTTPFAPSQGTAGSGGSFVVAAAGDGASGETTNVNVVNQIRSWNPNLLLYLGDVYEKGSPVEFSNWYASTYGQLRAITDPVVGNHEYSASSGAAGYFGYWGRGSDTYSFDAGGWHFIALNSNSQLSASQWNAQLTWLQTDLSRHQGACIIAYWHHPLYNIGPEGPTTRVQAFWTQLAAAHATLILNGHDHDYQRWMPLDGQGNPASGGITEIIAGGGGHSTQTITGSDPRVVKSVSGTSAYGALKLSLSATAAGFQYISLSGSILDSGSIPCQGAPPAPGSIAGTVTDTGTGQPIAGATVSTTGASTTTDGSGRYTLAGLAAGSYQVTASAAGYSSQTQTGSVSSGATSTLTFALAAVAAPGAISGAVTDAGTGQPIADATVSTTGASTTTDGSGGGSTTAGATYARKTLSSPYPGLYYRLYFFVRTLPSSTVNLLGDRTAASGSIARVYLDSSGRLGLRNDVGLTSTVGPSVSTGAWHSVELHVVVNGTASTTEAWLDGSPITAFASTSATLGTTAIGQVQLGENQTGRSYDVVFDDVAVGTGRIGP